MMHMVLELEVAWKQSSSAACRMSCTQVPAVTLQVTSDAMVKH